MSFPKGKEFINKSNAEYWAKQYGKGFKIVKTKKGFFKVK